MYKVIRHYQRPGAPNRTVRSGLTLEEAQAHCSDPETSSSTCQRPENRRRTRKLGPWFDGYSEVKR